MAQRRLFKYGQDTKFALLDKNFPIKKILNDAVQLGLVNNTEKQQMLMLLGCVSKPFPVLIGEFQRHFVNELLRIVDLPESEIESYIFAFQPRYRVPSKCEMEMARTLFSLNAMPSSTRLNAKLLLAMLISLLE